MNAFYHTLGIRAANCKPAHHCSHDTGMESFAIDADDPIYLHGTPEEILAFAARLIVTVTDFQHAQGIALAVEFDALTKELDR